MDAKPTLGYWSCRGRGHPCRLLLRHLGVDFTDRQYVPKKVRGNWDVSEWFGEKFNLGLDFPNLPYFIDGDINVTETNAILQTIASLYRQEYIGRSQDQRRRVIQVGAIVKEYDNKLITSFYVPNFGQEGRDGIKTFLEQNLQRIAEFMGEKVFLTGNSPTWPDFWFLELLFATELFEPGLYASVSPKFRRFVHAMRALEGVDEFLTETEGMKMNNVFAHTNN